MQNFKSFFADLTFHMPYVAILENFAIFGTARCKCEILSPETQKLTIKCCICSGFRRVRDIDTEKATIRADWDYSAPKWPKFTEIAIKAHGAVCGGHCSIISDLPVI